MKERGNSPPAAAGRSELVLQPRLAPAAAEALAEELKTLRGSDLVVNAAALSFIATPCLQVLLAAARSWRSDARALTVEPSEPLLASLADLGLGLPSLQSEVAPCP